MAPQRGPHMPPRRQSRLGRLGLSGRVRRPPDGHECQRADTVRQRGGHDSLSNRTVAGEALKPIEGRARSPGRLPHTRPSAVQSRSRSLDASRLRSSDVPLVTAPTRTTDRRSRARLWSVPDRTRALFVGEEHVDHVRPCVGGVRIQISARDRARDEWRHVTDRSRPIGMARRRSADPPCACRCQAGR
jgi:hypothetical protein